MPVGWIASFVALAALVAFGAYAARSGLFHKHVEQSAEWLEDTLGQPTPNSGSSVYVSRDFNYQFTFPPSDWHSDDAVKVALKANSLALARSDPPVWMALATRDFRTTDPDVGTLTDDVIQRLSAYFVNLESEPRGDREFAGQRCRRLVFQGKANETAMRGECDVLAHKGIAYWLILWSTAEAARQQPTAVAAEFDRIRKGFSLGHDRDNWKPRQSSSTFAGRQAAYEFRDVPPPWKEWPDPTSEDEQADLLLIGPDPDDVKDVTKKASVVVLLLDKPGDNAAAVAAARSYVDAQRRKTFTTTHSEFVADSNGPIDRDVQLGNVVGHVVKLHVTDGESRERFLTLAVVRHDDLDRLLVIQCECDWKRRTRWDAVFQQLLSRFRLSNR